MARPLGDTIGGRYALRGEIASGGMATVHLARQVGAAGFARIVAVKRLHERYARDPDFVAMFLDEARLVARIRHPNVVQTVDVVAEGGELFLVMEYVHGESLVRLVKMANKASATLPIPIVAAVMAGVLHGLHEAHEARGETGEALGIVHRDVSPHNLLVGTDGIARVLDFGIAKASERIQSTQQGQLKGKLSYMAPEQITNQPIDRRTDVYAAGVVLWECLTGTKLFQGGSEGAVLKQIILDAPRPPSSLNRAVSRALDAIVMRSLAREPDARFATAHEMAIAIEQATTVATASEVGATVSSLCAATITARAELIANIEMQSSSSNRRDAVDSLRTLSATRPDPVSVLDSSSQPDAPPIQTWPPTGAAAGGSFSPGKAATFPPPDGRQSAPLPAIRSRPRAAFPAPSGSPPPSAAGAGGAIAVVVASLLLVGAALATGGYLFFARRGVTSGPVATTSADGGDLLDGARPASASGAAGAASMVAVTSASAAGAATTCPPGMAFVPGGRYFMGSDEDLPAERPAHKVTLHAYCMDKLEVTTSAYRACSDHGDCKRAGLTNKWTDMTTKDSRIYDPLCNASDETRGQHPINCVDWTMADRFCKAQGKRLPTEAEWEFAARGSDGRRYPWGDAPPSPRLLNACGTECVAWGKKHGAALDPMFADADPWATTAPVGSFPAGSSRWGIEDLVGNVWEWVADYYAPYTDGDATDPAGPPSGTTHVMRGGAWNGSYADWVRPTFRFDEVSETRSHGIGFRCAQAP